MKWALEVEHLCLTEFCEGYLEGGFFNGDPGGCVKGPHWGAGGLFTGDRGISIRNLKCTRLHISSQTVVFSNAAGGE
jgi:hypothetical protein